jgi:integrase
VPINAILRDFLAEHLARTGRAGPERVFGVTGRSPFDPQKLQVRADRAWEAARLDRITPHGCRHTFASLMIAAGVGAKHLQTYLGHSSVATTLDVYGHLMPGAEADAAELLDAYLDADRERADAAARAAGADVTAS